MPTVLSISLKAVLDAIELTGFTYDSVSFGVGGQSSITNDVAFGSNGTKMYIASRSNTIYQYTLSSGFDLTTASYDSVSFNTSSQEDFPTGVSFSSDGTKMYVVGFGTNSVYQYSLSPAWDLSSASYDSVSLNASGQDGNVHDLAFGANGTKLYIVGNSTDSVYQYTLSSAWDLSTATYDSISKDVSTEDASPFDVTFDPNGTRMFLLGLGGDNVYQYTLSSAWDISTATYDTVSLSVGSQDGSPTGLAFSDDKQRLFIVGDSNDTVYQYSK